MVGWYAVIAGVRFTCIATLGVDDNSWRGGKRVGTPLTVPCGVDGGGCCGGTGGERWGKKLYAIMREFPHRLSCRILHRVVSWSWNSEKGAVSRGLGGIAKCWLMTENLPLVGQMT